MKDKPKRPYYVSNKQLYEEMVKYKAAVKEAQQNGQQKPQLPNYVATSIMNIANRLAIKSNFAGYSFRDEMISDGIENCFHGSTAVLTQEYGPAPIGQLVGRTVTVKSADGSWRPATVQHFGKQKLYEVGFGGHGKPTQLITQKVLVTENHRWFTQARLDNKRLRDRQDLIVTDLREGDVLRRTPYVDSMDKQAIVHGLVFGDGTGHRKSVVMDGSITQQGNKYASIRVCKKDAVRDQIIEIMQSAGYQASYPASAKGDPIFYLGRQMFIKDVPHTYDPAYIAGFIHGWWLADGLKSRKTTLTSLQITTSNQDAAEWLRTHMAYGGYHLVSYDVRNRPASKATWNVASTLYVITFRHADNYDPRVRYKRYWGEDDVYCVVEPMTKGFVLANGLLTGNCVMYIDNFDPARSNNPFAYLTQTIKNSFVRRIEKEKKQQYIKYKNMYSQYGSDGTGIDTWPDDDVAHKVISGYEDSLKRKKEKARLKKEERLLNLAVEESDDIASD